MNGIGGGGVVKKINVTYQTVAINMSMPGNEIKLSCVPTLV